MFLLVVLALLVAVIAPPASATVVVPVSEQDLAASAAAVVTGRVLAIEGHLDTGRRRVFTDIRIAIDEILLGELPVTELTVRQAGGRVQDVDAWIDGSPTFHRGERVLVFLATRPDGTLRVASASVSIVVRN